LAFVDVAKVVPVVVVVVSSAASSSSDFSSAFGSSIHLPFRGLKTFLGGQLMTANFDTHSHFTRSTSVLPKQLLCFKLHSQMQFFFGLAVNVDLGQALRQDCDATKMKDWFEA